MNTPVVNNPGYFAIVPANVRYCKKLKANAKLLYGEITALADKTGFCFAGNEYFAELYDVSTKQVSLWINELFNNGFVFITIDKSAGNKRYISIDKSMLDFIPKSNDPIHQKVNRSKPKGCDPIHQKVIYNNTVNSIFNIFKNGSPLGSDTVSNSSSLGEENIGDKGFKKVVYKFEEFWILYPKKQKKLQAENKYKALIQKGTVTHEKIMEGVTNYCAYLRKGGIEEKFIKQPTTWLNGGCRDDEYKIKVSSSPTTPKKEIPKQETLKPLTEEEKEQRKTILENLKKIKTVPIVQNA